MRVHDVDVLTTDDAWKALREARDGADPGDLAGGRLHLKTTGWQSDSPVDDEARDLLDCLTPLVMQPGHLAIAQLGQSLDGRIATQSGHSHYINGLESRVHLHRLRALMDAVVIGAGTASEDDPLLTVRHVHGRQPTRVILDPRGRVPSTLQLFREPLPGDTRAPTLHLVGDTVEFDASTTGHVSRIPLPLTEDGFSPTRVLDVLAELGLRHVLIEGGGVTVSRFLEAGVLHRLHLLVAPLLIGSGRPGLAMTPIDTLEQACRPRARTFRCGDDTLFDLDLTRS